MWFEYLYDRVAGPSLVTDALAGQKSVWNTAASKKALSDIAQLVNAGAFGPSKSWDSVNFGSEPSSADLIVNGLSRLRADGLVGLLDDRQRMARPRPAPRRPTAPARRS